jgi:outer membrane protein TolC
MLAGCAVRRKYEKPFVDIPPSFKELADWKVAEPADALPKGNWWVVFDDRFAGPARPGRHLEPEYQGYGSAVSRRDGAGARRAGGTRFPAVSGRAAATVSGKAATGRRRSRSLDAGWEIDLWGRVPQFDIGSGSDRRGH